MAAMYSCHFLFHFHPNQLHLISCFLIASFISAMAPLTSVSQRIEEARSLATTNVTKSEVVYNEILSKGPGSTEASSRDYEAALIGLGTLYRDEKRPHDIAELIKTSRDTFSSFAKAKTAKLGEFVDEHSFGEGGELIRN